MREALQAMDADDGVRAVVVTGAGRDFCVGADLEGGGTVFDEARAAENEGAERLALKAWDIRKPVIARAERRRRGRRRDAAAAVGHPARRRDARVSPSYS